MKKVLRLLAILAAVLLCVLPGNLAKASEEEVAEVTLENAKKLYRLTI